MTDIKRFLNALVILILCAVISGAYAVEIFRHELPCPLCMLQRIAMIGVATAALLNLRFGIRPVHYSLILFSALFGMAVSLRQIALHVCPQFPTFGAPEFGLSLFTWAFIVFFCVIFGTGIVNFFHTSPQDAQEHIHLTWFEKICAYYLVLITFANVVTTFLQCGFSPCKG
ncbi:MAG: disulfide bond formation protein B [Chlamydiia bacterium]